MKPPCAGQRAVKHGRSGAISFRAPAYGQEKFTRLRSDTLGEGYGPEELRAIIEGRAPLPAGRSRPPAGSTGSSGGINLLVDIQAKIHEGKGHAYENWATVYNLKQMAATLQFLQENNLLEYAALKTRAAQASDCFHALAGELREVKAALSVNTELKAASVDYAKTRAVFDGYKAAGYSKACLAEHEGELALYRAAQATFRRLLDVQKLPKMDALKTEGRELMARKKAAYQEYRAAKREMRDIVAAKGNIDRLLGLTEPEKDKEMQR